MKLYFEKKEPAFRVNEAYAVLEVLRLEIENYMISVHVLIQRKSILTWSS